MRRAQTVRHNTRPSLALGTDDLGLLREGDESNEDVLRKQLLDKDRENDKLRMTIQTLQDQLAQRPPLETIQELEREYKNLELLLQGTQRENERCMSELERGKAREKMLERELARLVGENWQAALDLSAPLGQTPTPTLVRSARSRSGSLLSSSPITAADPSAVDPGAARAHIEKMRLLILGMEQRLEGQEEKLGRTIERAEREGKRFEELRKSALAKG